MKRQDEILMADALDDISQDIMQYSAKPMFLPRDELLRWANILSYFASLLKDEE